MRATGWWSSLYFVVLVLVGYFMLLNLFLAVLMSNFSTLDSQYGAPARRGFGLFQCGAPPDEALVLVVQSKLASQGSPGAAKKSECGFRMTCYSALYAII